MTSRLAARRTGPTLAALVAVAALATACGRLERGHRRGRRPSSSAAPTPASSSADPCAKDSLQTSTDGQAHDRHRQPVYPPWFVDDKPENGKGFEGAVAAAVATKLGFTADEVAWIRVPFNNVDQADAEELRLRHQRVLDHRGAQAGRRLLLALLRRQAGRRHHQGLQGGRRHRPRRPQGPDARRPGRHDQPRRDQRRDRRRARARGSSTPTTTRCGPRERPDRRARRRPADRVLHDLRRARRRARSSGSCRPAAGRRSSSAWCSTRAAR